MQKDAVATRKETVAVQLLHGDFLASCRSWTADRLFRVLTSHCIFLHGGYITSALNDTPVLAKRLVTGLAQVAWRVVEKTGLTVLSALCLLYTSDAADE